MKGSINFAISNTEEINSVIADELYTNNSNYITLISNNSDLNSFTDPGKYIYNIFGKKNLANLPDIDDLGLFELIVTEFGFDSDGNRHILQTITDSTGHHAYRELIVYPNGDITYGNWMMGIYYHPENKMTAGTYKSVTVDKYGRVTGGTNPTTLEGYGITDAVSSKGGGTVVGETKYKMTEAETFVDPAINVACPIKISGNFAATTIYENNEALSAKYAAKSHTHNYIPLSGSTAITGDLEFPNSGTTMRGIGGVVGDNDFWRVKGGASATNAGFLEIATADDGDEPIYVRQYTGVFANVVRTAVLLNSYGNTEFPGLVYEQGTALCDKYAAKSHTHNYAGSDSVGGWANFAHGANYANYLNIQNISSGNINGLQSNYRFMGSNMSNVPDTNWYIGDIYFHNESWRIQRINQFANNTTWYNRYVMNGGYYSWETDLQVVRQSTAPVSQGALWVY